MHAESAEWANRSRFTYTCTASLSSYTSFLLQPKGQYIRRMVSGVGIGAGFSDGAARPAHILNLSQSLSWINWRIDKMEFVGCCMVFLGRLLTHLPTTPSIPAAPLTPVQTWQHQAHRHQRHKRRLCNLQQLAPLPHLRPSPLPSHPLSPCPRLSFLRSTTCLSACWPWR